MLLISFSFIFSHDFLTQCDYFNADILTIQGTRRLSEVQVVKQAQISTGINILSVHLETVRRRLVANPWIADAEVGRELPNGIHIRITEHQPLAVLNLGRKFLINTAGEIFKEKSASDPDNLPVVSGLEFSDISLPGKPLSATFESVLEVLRLGQQSECILPNRSIQRIHVDKEIGLTLYAQDHNSGRVKVIKLGYANYPNKYDRLKNVLCYLKKKKRFSDFETIDLNSSDRIVISPVKIQTSPGDNKEV